MPVDTSFYPKAPEQPNMLTTMSQYAGLQGQLQQNQLLARTMGAQQAIGQHAQESIGPDGTFDPNGFSSRVAADPNSTFGAVDAVKGAQEQRQAQLLQHLDEVKLAITKQTYMNQIIGALADKKNATPKDVMSAAGDLVNANIIDAKTAADEVKSMPQDLTQLPSWIRQQQLRGMQGLEQLKAYHDNILVNTGGQTQVANTAPLADQPPMKNTMAPGEASQPVGDRTPDCLRSCR